jgi:transposase
MFGEPTEQYHSGLVTSVGEAYQRIPDHTRCLPSYSPELNPDERLNADLKHALASKVQVRTKDKLKQVTTEHMNML